MTGKRKKRWFTVNKSDLPLPLVSVDRNTKRGERDGGLKASCLVYYLQHSMQSTSVFPQIQIE